jgi:hypothetical protein
VANEHLFPLAAYDSDTNYLLLCSGDSEMFSSPLPAAGGTGNLISWPQLICALDETGSLVQFLDCVDTSTVDPAGKTIIKANVSHWQRYIPTLKMEAVCSSEMLIPR